MQEAVTSLVCLLKRELCFPRSRLSLGDEREKDTFIHACVIPQDERVVKGTGQKSGAFEEYVSCSLSPGSRGSPSVGFEDQPFTLLTEMISEVLGFPEMLYSEAMPPYPGTRAALLWISDFFRESP